MAKVTITISDEGEEDGSEGTSNVNIKLESDPGFPGPAAENQTVTAAQSLGFRVWRAVSELATGQKTEVTAASLEEDDE